MRHSLDNLIELSQRCAAAARDVDAAGLRTLRAIEAAETLNDEISARAANGDTFTAGEIGRFCQYAFAVNEAADEQARAVIRWANLSTQVHKAQFAELERMRRHNNQRKR